MYVILYLCPDSMSFLSSLRGINKVNLSYLILRWDEKGADSRSGDKGSKARPPVAKKEGCGELT